MNKVLLTMGWLALCAGSAAAADMARKTPAPATVPVFSWTGFYVGGQIGASFLNVELTLNNGVNPEKMSPTKTGFIGGIQAGYLYQFSNQIVVGAELSYAWTDVTASKTVSTNFGGRLRSITAQDQFIAALRAGYAFGSLLPYVKVGYANSGYEMGFSDLSRGVVTAYPLNGRANGWVVGAGIDYALMPNIVMGLEYNYTYFNVGRQASTGINYGSFRYADGWVNMNYSLQSVVARLSYRF